MPPMGSEEADMVLRELQRRRCANLEVSYECQVGANGHLEGIFWASTESGWDYFFLGMAGDQRTECLATGFADDMSLPDLFRHADAWTERLREDGVELDLVAAMSRLPPTTKH
ncbi:hypothetical protein E2562_013251 [Oryza meyeriana var. granulata]|uniref:Uncharacterized protein n=1 Tax=Oryza meyeriana var. granulata TaxID=110450 RepID=A0A6G1D3C1_9ORYZ|nr:hypothetical protein E2562_013251 [Oryza meyeriana var. granulata]